MKTVNFKFTLLGISFIVTLVVAFVSRLFAVPGLTGWRETGIASLASLIVYHFASVIFIHKNKIVLLRYIFLILLIFACIFYYTLKHSLVYSVPSAKLGKDSAWVYYSKTVIVGTELNKKFKNAKSIAYNENRNITELFRYLKNSNPEDIWTDVQHSRNQLTLSYILLIVSLVGLLTHLTEEIIIGTKYYKSDVFISYNQEDLGVSTEINTRLKNNKIKTIIDFEAISAGEDINEFIRTSILNSRISLAIISKESLLSGWVATETINTFFLEKFDANKKFIACYLDNAFLDPKFANEAIKDINERLDDIIKQTNQRDQLGTDSSDLNERKSRLYFLKSNFGKIIQRLQNSKCIDIGNEKLNLNFPQLLKDIKK